MPDYKNMYLKLFRAVSESIDILQKAQLETEEIYINSSENDENKIVPLKILIENNNHNLKKSEK